MADEAKPDVATSTDDLEQLRSKIAETTREKEEFQRRAIEAERRVGEAGAQLRNEATARVNAEVSATDAALQAAETEASKLETDLATALSEGKYQEFSKIQRQLISAQTRVENLKGRKEEYAAPQVKPMEESPELQARREFLESRTPQTRAWIERHPQYFTDAKFQALAAAAHHEAVANGIQPDTTEYFELVETKTGERKAPETDGDDGQETAAPVLKAKTRIPAAAPSRGSQGSGGGSRTVEFKPTDRELEAIKISDPDGFKKDPAEAIKSYFTNKAALEKEGRLGPQQYH